MLHGMRTTSPESTSYCKRKIKEALVINKLDKERGNDKVMNQDKGTELSKIWLNLV